MRHVRSSMRGYFCLETSIGERFVARFNAAGGRGALGRRRVGAGELMGGRAPVHLGVMEDEVLEMDKLAGKPERKASVRKMPTGEKTVAQRAFVEELVEADGGVLGGSDRRQERQIEPGGDPVRHGLRMKFPAKTTPWFLRRASRSPATLLGTQTPI